MNFVKRRATPKKPKLTVANFKELKAQFSIDIKAAVTMKDVPEDMIVNWDQTAIKYVHPTFQLVYGSRGVGPSGLR